MTLMIILKENKEIHRMEIEQRLLSEFIEEYTNAGFEVKCEDWYVFFKKN